jgi:hypothetical protein
MKSRQLDGWGSIFSPVFISRLKMPTSGIHHRVRYLFSYTYNCEWMQLFRERYPDITIF